MSVDIPNYRVIERLGEGANSKIYRARCMRTGKDYAVKIVKIVKPEDSSFVDLLKAEKAIGSTMDHDTIRKLYELRIMRRRLSVRGAILFMEYVGGVTMSDRSFKYSMRELLSFFSEVAQGLHVMHMAGWVHADLKPENIMVTADNRIKLIDLGQSSKIREAKTKVQGTIHYMAPEQSQRGILDERTDVFGLGAALHRIITGSPLATDMNQTVNVHSQGLVGKRLDQISKPSLESLHPSVSRLILDCCQEDPAKRIAHMPSLIERLELVRTSLAKQAAATPTTAETDDPHDEPSDVEGESLMDAITDDIGMTPEGSDSVDIENIGDLEDGRD